MPGLRISVRRDPHTKILHVLLRRGLVRVPCCSGNQLNFNRLSVGTGRLRGDSDKPNLQRVCLRCLKTLSTLV